MATDQVDQDALAAEWGVALEAEQKTAAGAAAGNDVVAADADDGAEAMAAQWASMAEDGHL
jgi:flagellar motor switch protein FliM